MKRFFNEELLLIVLLFISLMLIKYFILMFSSFFRVEGTSTKEKQTQSGLLRKKLLL